MEIYKKKIIDIMTKISEVKSEEIMQYTDMLDNRYAEEYTESEIQFTKDSIEALDNILYVLYKLIEK